jgi:hypothetical protein
MAKLQLRSAAAEEFARGFRQEQPASCGSLEAAGDDLLYQQTARHQSLMSDPEVKRQWKEYSRSVKGMERLSMKAWFDVNYPKGGKGYRKNG